MRGRSLGGSLTRAGLLLALGALLWLPGTGSAGRLRSADLSIDKIQAAFSEPDRATSYSVPVHESDASATLSYQWTLSLEPVDPAVDVDGLSVDANCDNHGVLSGTDPTFVWHHGNKGDPVHDDDCNHDLQGKYGHQGLISVTVKDSAGWRCDATYKGTLSSDAAAAAGIDAASQPVCSGPTVTPPPPPPPKKPPPKPCKCILLTARIVPDSIKANLVLVHLMMASREELEITFTVHWAMTCLNGAVAACRGSLTVDKPPPIVAPDQDFGVYVDEGGRIKCKGGCGGLQDGGSKVTLATVADRTDIAGHRIPIVIRRTCQARKLPPIRLSIAFDQKGRPDRTKSRLR